MVLNNIWKRIQVKLVCIGEKDSLIGVDFDVQANHPDGLLAELSVEYELEHDTLGNILFLIFLFTQWHKIFI